MNICKQHDSDIAYQHCTSQACDPASLRKISFRSKGCPACREIKKLNLLINAYLEELADYAKTVSKLNKELPGGAKTDSGGMP